MFALVRGRGVVSVAVEQEPLAATMVAGDRVEPIENTSIPQDHVAEGRGRYIVDPSDGSVSKVWTTRRLSRRESNEIAEQHRRVEAPAPLEHLDALFEWADSARAQLSAINSAGSVDDLKAVLRVIADVPRGLSNAIDAWSALKARFPKS